MARAVRDWAQRPAAAVAAASATAEAAGEAAPGRKAGWMKVRAIAAADLVVQLVEEEEAEGVVGELQLAAAVVAGERVVKSVPPKLGALLL